MLSLKLQQFSSHLNETCYTYSLRRVDSHVIICVRNTSSLTVLMYFSLHLKTLFCFNIRINTVKHVQIRKTAHENRQWEIIQIKLVDAVYILFPIYINITFSLIYLFCEITGMVFYKTEEFLRNQDNPDDSPSHSRVSVIWCKGTEHLYYSYLPCFT